MTNGWTKLKPFTTLPQTSTRHVVVPSVVVPLGSISFGMTNENEVRKLSPLATMTSSCEKHLECAEVRALDVLGLTRPVLVGRYEEPLAVEIDAEIVEANRTGLQHFERERLATRAGALI